MIQRIAICRLATAIACVFALAFTTSAFAQQGVNIVTEDSANTFAQKVDITPLRNLAANHQGRINSFESHASTVMQLINGPRLIDDQPPSWTYLDFMLRPQAYADKPFIFVKNKLVRAEIHRALSDEVDDVMKHVEAAGQQATAATLNAGKQQINEALDQFLKTGLATFRMFDSDAVQAKLNSLAMDLRTTGKAVDQIGGALSTASPGPLRRNLRFVPPPDGSQTSPWLNINELADAASGAIATSIDPQSLAAMAGAWHDLETAWVAEDAQKTNESIKRFAGAVRAYADQVNARLAQAEQPALYPPAQKLALETWYFSAGNMTWVWVIYGLAIVPLLLSVVYRWPAARWAGLGMFLIAFGFHTFALGLRWYVSGRWPNSNMFEAITTAAWFGGVFAIVADFFVRRTAMRSIIPLGSAVGSMVAFMAVHFLPLQLSATITNRMPVLHDVWLYIHTNVIIFSYGLMFIAAVPATLYLINRVAGRGSRGDFARVGGAGSLIITGPTGESYIERAKANLGQVLDGTTMVLLELGFIMLWAGLVMGAIWADHSWGRPWGWDPKEVFALNTFIILLLLVHVRLMVRDKGLWTALLALAGAGVMIFNWVVINFTISGLHSYA